MELPLTYTPTGPNGRINFSAPPSAGGYNGTPGFDYQRTSEPHFQADMLRGNWEKNPLSDSFFSDKNVRIIQNRLKREVYEKSAPKYYVIDDQSVDELKIIMRAMYYQYAKNLPNDIPGQVNDLNTRVVNWSVPHILSAVDHHLYYIKDIQNLPVPMAHPVNLSSAGTRSRPQSDFM